MKAVVSLAPPILTAGILSLTLSACSGASQADLASASQSAAQSQAQKDAAAQQAKTQASLKAEVDALKAKASSSSSASQSSSSSSPSSSSSSSRSTASSGSGAATARHSAGPRITSCGTNLSVGPNTTCAFAANVESDYYGSGGGYQNLDVYSPVTGRYYSMTCNPGVPTVCRGGNNAVVYIR